MRVLQSEVPSEGLLRPMNAKKWCSLIPRVQKRAPATYPRDPLEKMLLLLMSRLSYSAMTDPKFGMVAALQMGACQSDRSRSRGEFNLSVAATTTVCSPF
jgi:hypothetical protein